MSIDDITQQTFASFLDWLYFRRVPDIWLVEFGCICCDGPCRRPVAESKRLDFPNFDQKSIESLEVAMADAAPAIALYLLANKYDVSELRKDIVERAYAKLKRSWSIRCHQVILWGCQQLPDHTKLYKLMADTFVRIFDSSRITCHYDQLLCQGLSPNLWLRAHAEAAARSKREISPDIEALCDYHEHDKSSTKAMLCEGKLMLRQDRLKREHDMMEALAPVKRRRR